MGWVWVGGGWPGGRRRGGEGRHAFCGKLHPSNCLKQRLPKQTEHLEGDGARGYLNLCKNEINTVIRHIASSKYATTWHKGQLGRINLLCCWDDPLQGSKCIREKCPYLHASELMQKDLGGEQDFFQIIPCTFAGMCEGCKWHRKRLPADHNFVVPPFELKEDIEGEEVPCDKGFEGLELMPEYDGTQWSLHPCNVSEPDSLEQKLKHLDEEITVWKHDIETAVRMFLAGIEDQIEAEIEDESKAEIQDQIEDFRYQ